MNDTQIEQEILDKDLVLEKNMADMFDPFNDYPHVKPVPIEEAAVAFKQFYRDLFANTRKNLKLPEWKESAEYRKADYEKWRKLQVEAELLLFRSALAV